MTRSADFCLLIVIPCGARLFLVSHYPRLGTHRREAPEDRDFIRRPWGYGYLPGIWRQNLRHAAPHQDTLGSNSRI